MRKYLFIVLFLSSQIFAAWGCGKELRVVDETNGIYTCDSLVSFSKNVTIPQNVKVIRYYDADTLEREVSYIKGKNS